MERFVFVLVFGVFECVGDVVVGEFAVAGEDGGEAGCFLQTDLDLGSGLINGV